MSVLSEICTCHFWFEFVNLFGKTRSLTLYVLHHYYFNNNGVKIVSITKFSIVIGSLRAYLTRNHLCVQLQVSLTFRNWTPVIGYPRDSRVNYTLFNSFLCTVSSKLLKSVTDLFAQKKLSQKAFLIPKFVIDTINYKLDFISFNSGSNCARNFKSASRFTLVRFWNYSRDYSLY